MKKPIDGTRPFIFRIDKDHEIVAFSEKNDKFLRLLPKLGEAINRVFSQIKAEGLEKFVVYMLGRVCIRHFESIVLLSSHGYGFRSMSVLRSLFEKTVDSFYLNSHPEAVDDLLDFGLVQLKKTGYEALARKREPDFDTKVARFKGKKSWSDISLVDRAKRVGVSDFIINNAYREANVFVHSSSSELEFSFKMMPDGILDPIESDNETERKWAVIALSLACATVVEVLRNQIACFDLPPCEELDACQAEFELYYEQNKLF